MCFKNIKEAKVNSHSAFLSLHLALPSSTLRSVSIMSNIGTKFILAQRFTFDPNNNSLLDQQNDNEVIRLGSNESRILLLLAEHHNEVVTRQQLHEFVWRDQGFQVDDSSLTQAISTLRKLLKDSTKSPQYVKTVPKRGYQLISSVERSVPSSASDETSEIVETNAVPDSAIAEAAPVMVSQPSENKSAEPVSSQEEQLGVPAAKTSNRGLLLALFIAVALPLMTFFATSPSPSSFTTVATFSDIPVKTPENHPDISQWIPSITQCVEVYIARHPNELAPVEVIATGGQNGQIALNYIHSPEHSSENVTLKLLAVQPDYNQVCTQ